MNPAAPSPAGEEPSRAPRHHRVPGLARLSRIPRQVARRTPFRGDLLPARIPLFSLSPRPSLPFPHPWNYREPLRILETFFAGAEADPAPARHNRYLDVPGFAPVLVTRDPRLIRAISSDTGEKPGQFDRDTLPTAGIARATGADTLLYANGPDWRTQKRLAAPPFARTTLFQPERFHDFERTFRETIAQRLDAVRRRAHETGAPVRVRLEDEIKPLMLEMLVNTFFGADVPADEIRDTYVPAIDLVIDRIVRDTVLNRLGLPLRRLPALTRGIAEARAASETFEHLTDLVLATRLESRGQWCHFRSDAPDDALRGNIRVFLAGALEATTSFASWALSHLARDHVAQQTLFDEIREANDFTPEALARSPILSAVLDETLRLTPSLYFHPRRASADTTVTLSNGESLFIPRGTHILLDVWHANRHEDHWGVAATGFPADTFAHQRWARLRAENRGDLLHFGFGHGPRFCPGKNLGEIEVALVVAACVKLFRFSAATPHTTPRAGVSTKPSDGVLVDLMPRSSSSQAPPSAHAPTTERPDGPPTAPPSSCPFHAREG